jgi:hypothetical protein
MRLEEQFHSNYKLVSHLRHTIRTQKTKNRIIRIGWILLSVLLLYIVLDYSVPYIIEFLG